ncbi:sulfite exporter TauE/SafE family protein [Pseudomonas sp. nanlin1]|uniref:sulfite exporter TauE/SafE family protein n=1 Tax=Pseudomonas sp. nanlin1 TaxID=3040605 RepID=UPI00388E74EE
MLIVVLGFIVGVILALTGAGGGILAVPLLVFGAGLSMVQASPIGLLAVALAAALGAAIGLKNRTVRYKTALLVAATGIVASPMGLWLAHRVPNKPLAIFFALVLLYVAARAYKRSLPPAPDAPCPPPRSPPPCLLDARRGKLTWTAPCARALCASGALAGGLSGLLGVGGGFVVVPALQRYTDFNAQTVRATSLAVIALVSLAGVATSAATGHLYWPVALPFSLGAGLGMLAGSLVAARLSAALLQRSFALVSGVIAVALLVNSL